MTQQDQTAKPPSAAAIEKHKISKKRSKESKDLLIYETAKQIRKDVPAASLLSLSDATLYAIVNWQACKDKQTIKELESELKSLRKRVK